MKKIFVITASCLFGLVTASVASAQNGLYVSGNFGVSIVNDLTASGNDDEGAWSADTSWDTGYAMHVAVGYDFNPIRTEVEFGYAKNDCDEVDNGEQATDGDVTATTILVNAYYDFHNSSSFVPYLGAGLGYAKIGYNNLNAADWDYPFDTDDSVFAYQFMAGVAYTINSNISVDLSYRYVGTSDPSLDDVDGSTVDFEYNAHVVSLGVKYTF